MTTQATAPSALTRGTVVSAAGGRLVLNVDNTTYQLHLDCPANPAVGDIVQGTVRVTGRKIWTMSAGGNFITPILGTPRMIQGMVKAINGKTLIVQAGTPVCVDLPEDRSAYDLKNGDLVPGVVVNITALPGARFELAGR